MEGLLIVESTLIDSMCIAEAACSKHHYYQDEHEQNVYKRTIYPSAECHGFPLIS